MTQFDATHIVASSFHHRDLELWHTHAVSFVRVVEEREERREECLDNKAGKLCIFVVG